MNWKSTLVLATLVVAAAATAQTADDGSAPTHPVTLKVGDKAPPLKIAKWIKGTPVTNIADGKVHVVEFWATWCGPCKMSIPHLTEMAKKFKGKADFTGVSVWEEESPTYLTGVESFVKEMGAKMDYNVAADGQKDANVMARTWMMAAGQDGIPTAFVVDKTGTIAWIGHPMDGLDETLGQVIAGTYDVKAEIARQEAEQSALKKRQELLEPFIKAMSADDKSGALLELDTIFKEDPALEVDLASMKFSLLLETDPAKAFEYGWTLTKTPDKFDPIQVFNNSAWAMVDPAGEVKNPDLKLALAMAELAVKGTDNKDPFSMDTLAFVYFKLDNLDKAIQLQEKAVTLAKTAENVTPETLKEMTDRLAEFKAKKAAK